MALSKFVWKDGEIIRLRNAKVNIFSPSVQYARGGFEGIRFYRTEYGPAVFRLQDHLDRFFYTARVFRMSIPYSYDELTKAICALIVKNGMDEGYIRPYFLYMKPELGLRSSKQPVSVAIAVSSWDKKLASESLRTKISPVMRVHPKAFDMKAKMSGTYNNSILALIDVEETNYDEAILLDYEGYVAEGSAENIFMAKSETLFTPALGMILPGVTRETLITLAADQGCKVHEGKIAPSFLFLCDEVFLCGTAMEVLPVISIDRREIGSGKPGPITEKFAELYQDVVHGRMSKYHHWLTFANAYKRTLP